METLAHRMDFFIARQNKSMVWCPFILSAIAIAWYTVFALAGSPLGALPILLIGLASAAMGAFCYGVIVDEAYRDACLSVEIGVSDEEHAQMAAGTWVWDDDRPGWS